MGSNQVANDTIKLLGGAMLVLFLLPFFLGMVDCVGVATGIQEPPADPYAEVAADLERAIAEAEAQEQARWRETHGRTGNGTAEKAIGAYYPDADEEASVSGGDGLLWMAGGLLLSLFGCLGAVGFLLFGPASPVEQQVATESGRAEAGVSPPDVPPDVPPASPSSPEPGVPAFDAYGRPLDDEPVPLEGYWTHLALVGLLGGGALLVLLIGPLRLAVWLGLALEG